VNYAIALGTVGRRDQGRKYLELGLARAERLKHAQTTVFAHTVAGYFHAMVREPEELALHADAVRAIVQAHPMALWAQAPTVLRGYNALLKRRYENCCAMLTETIAAGDTLQYYLWRPVTFRYLAEAFVGLGDHDKALESIDKGLHEIELGRDRWYEAELHRIKGRALSARGDGAESVVDCLRAALAVAKTQSAKLFELRAAVDLASHWSRLDRPREARTLLAPVYGSFTEGFDAPDLKEANELLSTLSAG
jgi:hypothetical protein